jgi:soluble lytic murein transglycosylase
VALIAVAIAAWLFRDYARSPQALYQEAQTAQPERATALYARLSEKLPQIEEYTQIWTAAAMMPDLEALRTLQAVAAYRPQSPAAHQAHVALARHLAAIEAPEAEQEYRTALALSDSVALRLELARYLEEQGDEEAAYAEYLHVLGERADAFEGMRRTGTDPLAVAKDLNAAYYYSDAFETLRGVEDPEALPERAVALAGLYRHLEAEEAYAAWLEQAPNDSAAQLGLAQSLVQLERPDEALSLLQELDTADGQLAQADILAAENPEGAIGLYVESPYPIAWWSATSLLEAQGRLTETLPLYAQLGESYNPLSDDAAYRLITLAQRVEDANTQAEGEALLEGLGLSWLGLRAGVIDLEQELALATADPLVAAGGDIVEKAQALEAIGRDDLAQMELVLAAQARRAPEVDLAMAKALASRNAYHDSQAIAAAYLEEQPHAPRSFWELSYPQPYSATVEAAAAEFDVDPRLIWAVMREESRYDPEALSYVGARGLMQVMPPTQTWIAEMLGEDIPPGDAFTPKASIRMGAWFLRFLLDYFEDDLELVVAAYNGGAGSVDGWLADPRVSNRDDLLRWISYGETREYLSRVLLSYEVYKELYPDSGNGE